MGSGRLDSRASGVRGGRPRVEPIDCGASRTRNTKTVGMYRPKALVSATVMVAPAEAGCAIHCGALDFLQPLTDGTRVHDAVFGS